jgi:hypothetical protein
MPLFPGELPNFFRGLPEISLNTGHGFSETLAVLAMKGHDGGIKGLHFSGSDFIGPL